MFSSLRVRNVQQAYVDGLRVVREEGRLQDTRNGSALVIPWPVVTVYERPLERVLLDPVRDANPFFHLLEGMWMLAGRNDVESIGQFLGSLAKFSDDGVTYHGAYGYRWRHHFDEDDHWCRDGDSDTPIDQLAKIIELLRANPADRRIVLQMWDAETDLGREGRDFPCNTQIYFRVEGGALQMTICNRSNDAIWGAYGANAVHMSVLQEFMAAACGLRLGAMYQLSNNLHAYSETLDKVGEPELYSRREVGPGQTSALIGLTMYDSVDFAPTPLFRPSADMPVAEVMRQLDVFWDRGDSEDSASLFTYDGHITLQMVRDSYLQYKAKNYDGAAYIARNIPGSDWRRACVEWLERRAARRDA